MALLSTRINLFPTVRTLASGVPASNVALRLPALSHGEHHAPSGPRSDAPPSWIASTTGHTSLSRINARPTPFTRQRFFSTSAVVDAAKASSATGVPDYSAYTTSNPHTNRALSYFMVGSLGVLAASGAKATVSDVLSNMSASADVLALAKVEVEMASIPEGRSVIIKWRGKPVFIRHRTPGEIEEANQVDVKTLRDPQTDDERVQRPEWLVMVGVCTHLGCVPIGEAGDYGGWFCPCHGSHYDISGRIRRGPAPLNLEVPEYTFNDGEEKIVVG